MLLEIRSLAEAGANHFERTGGLESHQEPLSLPCPAPGLEVCALTPGIYVGPNDLTSGPHAGTV